MQRSVASTYLCVPTKCKCTVVPVSLFLFAAAADNIPDPPATMLPSGNCVQRISPGGARELLNPLENQRMYASRLEALAQTPWPSYKIASDKSSARDLLILVHQAADTSPPVTY